MCQPRQSEVITRRARDVLVRTPADFVCALDADEFLNVPSRPMLDGSLQQVPIGMYLLLAWQTYVPDFAAPGPVGDVRKCIAGARRLVQEGHSLHKVAVARHFLENGNALIVPATISCASSPLLQALPCGTRISG